jgi:TolA-binding protein
MKTTLTCLTLAALLSAVVQGYAQDTAADPLKEAAEALAGGSEIRAWKLLSENAAAFNDRMGSLDPALVVWVADQYRRQKRYEDANGIADKIVADQAAYGPDVLAQAMLVKGDVLRDQENFAAARLEYQSLERNAELRKTPAGRTSRFRLVEINRLTKNYEAAEEILERLRDSRDPATQAETCFQSAMVAYDREAYEEARELVAEARKLDPAHVEALFLEAKLNLIEDRLQDPELEIGTRVLSSYVIPGRPVTLKMQDRNLAIVRGGTGIPVQLETSSGGDSESVVLLPSPRDATLFRATIHSVLGAAEAKNMQLEVNGSDVVTYRMDETFQKANDLEYTEKTMIVASDAELTASSGEFVSEEVQDQRLLEQRIAAATRDEEAMAAYVRVRDTSVIRPGNEIHVQVVDADRDQGSEPDQVFVECRTSSGDAISGAELTETGPHTGMFRGSIPTARAAPRPSATGTVKGSDPFAPLTTKDTGSWSGAGEGVAYGIDLMAAHPLSHAAVSLDAQSGVSRARLVSGLGEEGEELAATHPTEKAQYGYVDLGAHFGAAAVKTAAYLYTEVKSGADQAAVLKIGSCDGVVCWVNGERVHNNQGGRLWKPEEDVVNINLRTGVNGLLVRVSQLTGPWGVSVTLLDSTGGALPDVPSPAPLKTGVISKWYLFDRLTPEQIKVAERLNINRPIRVAGEFFYWVPVNVCPPASLAVDGDVLKAVFNRTVGIRHLRWAFDAFSGSRVTVKSVDVKNHFGEQVLPVDVDYSAAAANRTLEVGPGDKVSITYTDERRISSEEVLEAKLTARFHDATVSFLYDIISMAPGGSRIIKYDPALRYRAGETKRLVVRVVDYDADTSEARDTVKVLIENSEGERTWLDALETKVHSGEFVAILRLGDVTEGDTVRVGPDIHLSAVYKDRENSDGVLARTAGVLEAADEEPELIAYRSTVRYPEPKKGESAADVEPVVTTEASDKGSAEDPVVTSMVAPVSFRVIYPGAAVREGSTLEANIRVVDADGTVAGAEESGRACVVEMKVRDGKLAEFSGEVELMTREPLRQAGENLLFAVREKDHGAPSIVDARGGEAIKVTVTSLDGSIVREAHYRMASDGQLQFMDNRYSESADSLHAGDYVYLSVKDPDMDKSDALDSLTVKLTSGTASRDVTLSETLPRSGRFTGRQKTEPATTVGGDGLPVAFGGTIKATYCDETSVAEAAPRDVVASLGLFLGADGTISGFSKRFSEEDIAVRTRLLTAEALFEMAKDYRKTDQDALADEVLAEGRMILEEAIADYPHTEHAPHAEYLLGDLAQELEHYGEALGRYNKVLSSWPDSEFAPRAQLRKGVCLEKREDFDNAMDAYVELTYLYPKSELVSDAVVRLGQHFYRTEAYGVAGRIFGRFEAQHQEHPLAAKTLFLSAQSFLKGADQQKGATGKYDAEGTEMLAEAANAFDKLIDAYDDKELRAEAMYWLGDCRVKQSDYKQAYMAFKGLTIDYPETKWAKFARGQLVQNEQAFSDIGE